MNPYVSYYVNQAGSGIGPVFQGAAHQRGFGFFGNLFRAVFPLFKSGAKAIGTEALNAGFGLLRDKINQKDLKTSLKERMRDAGNNLMSKAEQKIDHMQGSGYKCCRKRKKQHFNAVSKRSKVPVTQLSVEEGSWVRIKPIAAISNDAPLEFHIPAQSEEYIDPSETQLLIKCKITKADGSALSDSAKVAPINNFLHSMFSDCSIQLNQKQITSSSQLYPYRALLETLFSYNSDAKSTRLQQQLWFPDDFGQMDSCTADNSGYIARQALAAKSKTLSMLGRLHSDIFQQGRLIPNGVSLDVKLTPAKPNFALMSGDDEPDYRIKICDATLLVRKCKLSASVSLGHAAGAEIEPFKIPINRTEMRAITISQGLTTKEIPNHVIGQMPVRFACFLISNSALNGRYDKNPLNAADFTLNHISLNVNGRLVSPSPLAPDFDKGDYIECYNTTFSGTGLSNKNDGHCVNYSQYPNCACAYFFDLTADLSANEGHWSVRKSGTLNFEIKFKKALTEPVTCITYCEYQNLIQIDKSRNVLTDY
ncbi:hypothetical protein B566_EDAN017509 [Ephemera danica]|nr:hypothetical protein B566_EDAN017509 [Ephemera danica]